MLQCVESTCDEVVLHAVDKDSRSFQTYLTKSKSSLRLFLVRSHSTGRSVRDLSSAFTGSGLPPAILAAQKEAERQRQIMAVLQREKQIFEQMQRDSSTFRQKEHVN